LSNHTHTETKRF